MTARSVARAAYDRLPTGVRRLLRAGVVAGRVAVGELSSKPEPPVGTICPGDVANLHIGPGVSFGGNVVLFGTAPITIGAYTVIAMNSVIQTATYDYNDHPIWRQRIDRPVTIGAHVWIGTGAIVLPGVVIGSHAVVGAGSVVTANVPEAAIVAGNPARILRYRAPESYQRAPEISQWDEGVVTTKSSLSQSCKWTSEDSPVRAGDELHRPGR